MSHRIFILCLLGYEYFFSGMASAEPNLSIRADGLMAPNMAPQINSSGATDHIKGAEAAGFPKAVVTGDPSYEDNRGLESEHLDRRLLRSQFPGTDLFLPKGLADLLGSPQVG